MPKKNTLYVDEAINIIFSGSMMRINFGVGNPKDFDEIHSVVMPIDAYINLVRNLVDNISNPQFIDASLKFNENVREELMNLRAVAK